ncbi:type II secretion system protein GspD [Lutibacter sp.]
MKKNRAIKTVIIAFIFSISSSCLYSQNSRLIQLHNQLESIIIDSPGLNEKVDINVSNVVVADFLRTIAKAHNINLHIANDLNKMVITNNFTNATVIDVLLFVCKEYLLTIDITGNILAIKKITPVKKQFQQRNIPIQYIKERDLFTIDLKQDTLFVAFKEITNKTGNNIVFTPDIQYQKISAYIKEMPFESALHKIAFSNNLKVSRTKDNYFLVEKQDESPISTNKNRKRTKPKKDSSSANYYYKVLDSVNKDLEVDFEDIEIATIIKDVSYDLNINLFVASPLKEIGKTTIKNSYIAFEELLTTMLEPTAFGYKKNDNIFYFGKKEDISVRQSVIVPLLHRSIEIMNNQGGTQRNTIRSNFNKNTNYNQNMGYGSTTNNSSRTNGVNFSSRNDRPTNNTINSNRNSTSPNEGLLTIFPEAVTKDLDIKTDLELNSFIINGASQQIQKFKDFVRYIDKPIPVITIEVMILEINRSATVETGISWGIGDEVSKTTGSTFPTTDMTIGSKEINKIISNNNGFGSLNIGKVLPEFYMNIKAMESNGDVKVRSTPKLSTLNGHRSSLSIGETTYYVVTNQNYYGSQIPQASEIKNYQPIDAQLAIDLKPLVSGDGQITMEINVIQSSFNGEKIDADAPPGMNSRQFTSIVRVKDQELIILGGLEEKVNGSSGTGVPFLARIPIIKWFFSSHKREDSKKKLVVLIKPTVIY